MYTKSSIPTGGATLTAVRVAISVQKQLVQADAWQQWVKDAISFAREWLGAQGIKVLDVLPPTLSGSATLRVVLWLSAACEGAFYKLCGHEAVLCLKYIENDDDRNYFSVVPLLNCTREEALKRAAFHGNGTWGVVPLRNGSWGVRVRATEFDVAAEMLHVEFV